MNLKAMIPNIHNATKELHKFNEELAIALALYKELRDIINADSDAEASQKIDEIMGTLHEGTEELKTTITENQS